MFEWNFSSNADKIVAFLLAVTILAILATCFWNGWRHTRAARDAPLVAGTLAMLAALAVMACVDFPLARPTEAAWWWCGVAMIALIERRG